MSSVKQSTLLAPEAIVRTLGESSVVLNMKLFVAIAAIKLDVIILVFQKQTK